MISRPLLIGIIAAAAFAGTAVAGAQMDWTANLSDPGNPIWQQMPQSGSAASPQNFNNPQFPDMPVTFRQVIWLISQYDRYVIQPMRNQIADLQQHAGQSSSVPFSFFSSSASFGGSCGTHHIGDTYWVDQCHVCTCTSGGATCTQSGCGGLFGPASSTPSYGACGFHQIGDTYAAPDRCNVCTCTGHGEICTQRACGSSSSAGYCANSVDCSNPPLGCFYANPVSQNGCVVSCGALNCGFNVGNASSSSSSTSCEIADCAAPPPGCHYQNPFFRGCNQTCGQLICDWSGRSSSVSRGMCATYTYNSVQDTECAVCGDGLCSPYENCVPASCANGHCTNDCGGLYCPQDCTGSQNTYIPYR